LLKFYTARIAAWCPSMAGWSNNIRYLHTHQILILVLFIQF
jgi:hypothetical protein